MSSSYEKFKKRRLISSYFSVVLSIFLVLFLLGIFGLFVLNSKQLSDHFKEEIPMTVFFKTEANDSVINAFAQEMKTARFVKSATYVSKEEAAKIMIADIGENFMDYLGENPLKNSFDIRLKASYIHDDSLRKIDQRIRKNEMVADVGYDKVLVKLAYENIEQISLYILILAGVMAIIAILLINGSIRLSIYSNRFIIKTMQMVGATKAFIRRPFIVRSVTLGVVGALLAVGALVATLLSLDYYFPNLGLTNQPLASALVLVGVLVVGVLIAWVSTFFATQRYLNLRTDDLY